MRLNFAIPPLLMNFEPADLMDDRIFGSLVYSADEIFEGICLINQNKIFTIGDYFLEVGIW